MAAIFSIPMLIIWIISIVGMWKMYEKAGKPGWAAIIPIYNIIVLLEIVGKPLWWFLLLLVPCVNIIFAVWMLNLLSKSFGQSEGFTIDYCCFRLFSTRCWVLVITAIWGLQVPAQEQTALNLTIRQTITGIRLTHHRLLKFNA